MRIDAGTCVLRPYSREDAGRLVLLADDRRIARNMTEVFPHPYTAADAEEWMERCVDQAGPPQNFAIDVEGVYSGGIGINLGQREKRHVAGFGYWLDPELWGRGIMTGAAAALVDYALSTFAVDRLQATVFGWNPGSARVLEKCGFTLEARLRSAITRFGEVTDELIYGLLRDEWELSVASD